MALPHQYSLSVIIPAYNEEKTIAPVLNALFEHVPDVGEVIVIDDGSADETARQVAEADDGGTIAVWGDGSVIRSYTYVDVMVDGIYRLMQSDLEGAVNIGCPEYVTVDELVAAVIKASGKTIHVQHIDGPVGVQSRNFSNERIYSLGWKPRFFLKEEIGKTYPWVAAQVEGLRLASKS